MLETNGLCETSHTYNVKRGEGKTRNGWTTSLPQLTASTHPNFLYGCPQSTVCAHAISRFGRRGGRRENLPLGGQRSGDAEFSMSSRTQNRIPTIGNQLSYPL
jgi:hypothetical protein